MQWRAISFVFLVATLLAYAQKTGKVDDWDFNQTTYTKTMRKALPMPMARMKLSADKIGFAVGGAKDVNNFLQNLKEGYLPKLESITYEGVFYRHYFDIDTDAQTCDALLCPTYALAVDTDPFTKRRRYFVAVGLKGGKAAQNFTRPPLNLTVVLDVSGSMSSPFNRYYYDKKAKRGSRKSKIAIATETIVAMMKHLRPEDRLGVVLFDNDAYRAKPLRKVAETDMQAIARHILDLHAMGGTNWSAGYKEALKLFETIPLKGYENRILFLTDAMPNRGELSKEGLLGLAKSAAKRGIHTTFIGVGVDFNPALVDYIAKIRGANYYTVDSKEAFEKRLDKEFDMMVTPLAYDLHLNIESDAFKIDAIYGSPNADVHTGDTMYISTLFPSSADERGVKGGVVLVRLASETKAAKKSRLTLSAEYLDREGKKERVQTIVDFARIKTIPHYDDNGIRKAILLSRYVTLMQNWLIDAHKGCDDRPEMPPIAILRERCTLYPPMRPDYPERSAWERGSCKLDVSEGYGKLFAIFADYFDRERKRLNDPSLKEEANVLHLLLDRVGKKDDWSLRR